MKRSYTITKDSDMLAPQWLALRINYRTIRFVYRVIDGASHLKGQLNAMRNAFYEEDRQLGSIYMN